MAYSHSKLKVYDECALRYRYKYIDKIPEPAVAPKPALVFGTIMHAALEGLYKKIQTSGQAPAASDLKQFIQSEMEKSRAEHDRLSDQSLSEESFQDYLQLGQGIVDRYYVTYAPFTQAKVNGLEKVFSYDLPNGQKLTGVVDRLDIAGNVATIVDYKTDKDIKPISEFASTHQQQMTTYAARVLANYPHAVTTIRGKLIYLRLEKEVEREITPEAIQQAIQIITDKISQIEHTLFAYNMGEKEAFWPSEGPQCRRCAYQVMCPLRKHKFQADEVANIVETVGETTVKKLIDKFYTIKQQQSDLEEQLTGIKEFLEEYVLAHHNQGRKKIYGDVAELRVEHKNELKPRDESSAQQLKNYLVEHQMFDHLILSLNTNKLTKTLESQPALKSELADLVQRQEKYIVGWVKKMISEKEK